MAALQTGERQEMGGRIKVAGYVKLAKLWEKRREEAMRYHQKYYSDMFLDNGEFELMGVYVDITGSRQQSVGRWSGSLRTAPMGKCSVLRPRQGDTWQPTHKNSVIW